MATTITAKWHHYHRGLGYCPVAPSAFFRPMSAVNVRYCISIACGGMYLPWVPECLMAALADILHATADVHQQSGILAVDRLRRFEPESLQRHGKGVKIRSILLDE